MHKTTLIIGKLRNKKFLKVIKNIQEKFPQYHLIVEVERSGWFSTTYVIWVREPYYISSILKILGDELHV